MKHCSNKNEITKEEFINNFKKMKAKEEYHCEILAFDGFEELNELNENELNLSIFFMLDITKLKENGFSDNYINEIITENQIYFKASLRDLNEN